MQSELTLAWKDRRNKLAHVLRHGQHGHDAQCHADDGHGHVSGNAADEHAHDGEHGLLACKLVV